jgi:hypothetical protein
MSVTARRAVSGRVEAQRLDAAEGLVFKDAVVVDVDLSDQRIPVFQASATVFERCDFSGSRVTGVLGVLPWATYRDCTFRRTDLRRAAPSIARFERCTFENARLDKWFSTKAEFVDCRFVGPLNSVRFYGSVHPPSSAVGRTRNEFVGNDFGEADLTDVDFVEGIDIGAQRWPASPAYAVIRDLPAGLAAAEAEISRWPEGRERSDGLEMLRWMQGVYAGQPATVRKRGQLSETTERIWSIIERASAAAAG